MNISMIVYSYYSRDARVRRYAELLAGLGHKIDIICLKENYHPEKNIQLIFYPFERRRYSQLWYIIEYSLFFLFSILKLTRNYFSKKYTLIHIHNMPDFLVFTCIIPKLFGAKIILDIHDPMPEVYKSKYQSSKSGIFINTIIFIERLSLNFSDYIITANAYFKKILVNRNKYLLNKIQIIQNFPDAKIFKIKKKNNSQKFILMYMGTIADRYMLSSAITAVSILKTKISNFEFKIFPKLRKEGKYLEHLRELISEYNLNNNVSIKNPIPVEKISQEINKSDLGILLLKKDFFTESIIPVKLLEFIQMEKPVVATKTKALSSFFPKNLIYFLKSNTPQEIAKTIIKIYKNRSHTAKKVYAQKKFNQVNNWLNESLKYKKLISNIIN